MAKLERLKHGTGPLYRNDLPTSNDKSLLEYNADNNSDGGSSIPVERATVAAISSTEIRVIPTQELTQNGRGMMDKSQASNGGVPVDLSWLKDESAAVGTRRVIQRYFGIRCTTFSSYLIVYLTE